MIPLTTGNTNGCNPISSNCVIWQGPDLDCIDVCNGDTISIIIAKIAEFICHLDVGGGDFDLSLIDWSCYGLAEDPETLSDLINIMIQFDCDLTTEIQRI